MDCVEKLMDMAQNAILISVELFLHIINIEYQIIPMFEVITIQIIIHVNSHQLPSIMHAHKYTHIIQYILHMQTYTI